MREAILARRDWGDWGEGEGAAAAREGGGKHVKHRVEWLYTPIPLNNAPIDFIFGVDKLYVFVRRAPMMEIIISIISM